MGNKLGNCGASPFRRRSHGFALVFAQRLHGKPDLPQIGLVHRERMKLAIIKGDRNLAAACFARFDTMPSNLRKTLETSKKDVSEALLGDEHLNAVEIVDQTDYDIARANILVKQLSGVRVPSTGRIATGLRLKEMSRITGREYDNHGDIIEEKKD